MRLIMTEKDLNVDKSMTKNSNEKKRSAEGCATPPLYIEITLDGLKNIETRQKKFKIPR